MINFDKNFLKHLQDIGAKKLKVFLYESGCSGTKVDVVVDDFSVQGLTLISPPPSLPLAGEERIEICIPEGDLKKLSGSTITRVIKADHTGQEKIRYILSHPEVKERCGCGSSFSFDKKAPVFDLEKLKKLKKQYN